MNKEIFPFGATYIVGGDFPPKECAREDLKKMRDLGFTVFRGFVPRSHIEREAGVYSFSDVDEVLDIAAEVGIKCALTVGVGPPPDITKEEISEGVIGVNTKIGKPYPQFQPCFDNPNVRRGAAEFLTALASRFKDHPGLFCWVSWNEPHITYSNIACYCEYSVGKFRKWLEVRYGSLEGLSKAWNRNFKDFKQVNPPNRPLRSWGTYKPWLDWRDFCDDNLTEWVKFVSDSLKKGDPNHPTHTNLLFHQILYNQPAVGADPWKMADRAADTLGVSIYLWTQGGGDFPWCYSQIVDTVRSAASAVGKDAWVTELQGGPTIWAHSRSVTPSPEQIELWAWQTVARGGKGQIYWLWRPRIGNVGSGWENNEFGLVAKDGSLRPRAEAAGKACRIINRNMELFLKARPKAEVAILQSQTCKNAAGSEIPDETVFHPYRGERRYYAQSQLGAYKMLWESKIPCDFINPPLIAAGLKNYSALLMPFTYMIDAGAAKAIIDFVRNGGCLIADFGCAMKDEYGAVHLTSPAFGLNEAFGGYSYDIETPEEDECLRLTEEFKRKYPSAGAELPLHAFRETLRSNGKSQIIAEFLNGEPAIIENSFGKGRAVLVGTLMFQSYLLKEGGWREFVRSVLHANGVESPVEVRGVPPDLWSNIEIGLLGHNRVKALIVLNHNKEDVSGEIRVRGSYRFVDLESEAKLRSEEIEGYTSIKLDLPGKKTRILKGA